MSVKVITALDANESFSFRPSGDITAEDRIVYATSQAIMRKEVNFNPVENLGFTMIRMPAGHIKIPVERTIKAATEIQANFSEHLRFGGTGEQWESVTTRWRRFQHDEAWFDHQASTLNVPEGATSRAHMRTIATLKRAEFNIFAQELSDGYALVGGRRPFLFAIGAGYGPRYSKEGRRLGGVLPNVPLEDQGLNYDKLRKATQLLLTSSKGYPGNAVAVGNYIQIEDSLQGDKSVTRLENIPQGGVLPKGYNGMGFNGMTWEGEKGGVRIVGVAPLEGGGDALNENAPKEGEAAVLKADAFPTVDSDANIVGGIACLSENGAAFMRLDSTRKLTATVNGVNYYNSQYSAEGAAADKCINKATGEIWQAGDVIPNDVIFKAAGTFSSRKVGRNPADSADMAGDAAARFTGELTWNTTTQVSAAGAIVANGGKAIIQNAAPVSRVYFFAPNMVAATIPGDAPQYEFYPGKEVNKNHFKGVLTLGYSILDPECFGMVEIATPYPGLNWKNANPNA